MTPQELDSFAYGFNLTNAAYSGGAGGTFTNLVAGGQDWAMNGGTPTFNTFNGMEGVTMSGAANGAIRGEHRAMFESTIIVTARLPDNGTHYLYGGLHPASNTFALMTNANKSQAFMPFHVSGYSSAVTALNTHVFAVSFSPMNGSSYAQADSGAVTQGTASADNFYGRQTNYYDAGIGEFKSLYTTAWIGRVLVFDRALHYRDNASLQALILSEMTLAGI